MRKRLAIAEIRTDFVQGDISLLLCFSVAVGAVGFEKGDDFFLKNLASSSRAGVEKRRAQRFEQAMRGKRRNEMDTVFQ